MMNIVQVKIIPPLFYLFIYIYYLFIFFLFSVMVWPLGSVSILTFCFADFIVVAKISLDFFVLPLIAVLCGCIGTLMGPGHLFDSFLLITLFGFDFSCICLTI